MYTVSNTVKALFDAGERQILRITGRDRNGTVIAITDENVMNNSFNIDRCSCIGEKLEVGSAVAAEMTLKLNNADGTYDGIVFEGAELFVEIGIADWSQSDPTVYWIPCGFFTPDAQPRWLTIISLNALDRMVRFDGVQPTLLPWTDNNGNYMTDNNGNILYFNADIAFPKTIADIVRDICVRCNVPFSQDISSLPNANTTISAMPVTQETASYRTILQWCAGIMGCCAFIDWNGELRLQWYASADYTCTTQNRFSSDLFESDVSITGVTYTSDNDEKFVAGTEAYAVDVTGNMFLESNTSTNLSTIYGAIGGYTYRPFSASVLSAPWLYPMDVITFTDKDGNDHNCAVTNVNFGLNGTTNLAGKGMTAQVNSYAPVSGLTPAQVQALMVTSKQASTALQALDNSLTQQEIFDRLTDGGLEQGLALEPTTNEGPSAAGDKKIFLNMDYARFGKLVADFIHGGTLMLGGLDNESGVLHIANDSGEIIGTWDNTGIYITDGGISLTRQLNSTESVSLNITNGSNNLFTLTYNGAYVNSELTMDGSMIKIQSVEGDEINIWNNEISMSNANNEAWFVVNAAGGNPKLYVYGDGFFSGTMSVSGNILCNSDIYCNGTFHPAQSASGTFTTADGKTVTVDNGIITSIT